MVQSRPCYQQFRDNVYTVKGVFNPIIIITLLPTIALPLTWGCDGYNVPRVGTSFAIHL